MIAMKDVEYPQGGEVPVGTDMKKSVEESVVFVSYHESQGNENRWMHEWDKGQCPEDSLPRETVPCHEEERVRARREWKQ
jgi:hypothetical protein